MSQVSDNLLGLNLDDGAAFFVKESAQSETGVATITNVLLETFKFIGAQARNEYLMPQMTQMDWALKAFENHVPDCALLYDQAMTNPSPMAAIGYFDELVKMAAGSSAAPCLRVIPGYAVLQNAYKSAESIQDSLHGQYKYDGYIKQDSRTPIMPAAFTPAQLEGVCLTIDEKWTTVMTALQLETITQLARVLRLWDQASLGTIGDGLRADDAMSVLRSMSIYHARPQWAQHEVHVDADTGRILVDGAIPTDAQMQAAFPAGANGQVPYHGGTRQLSEWAIRHNAAMMHVPAYGDVEYCRNVPAGGALFVRDTDGRGQSMTHEEIVRLVEGFTDPNGNVHPPVSRLFRLRWGRPGAEITEYCLVPMLGQGANNWVQQMRSAAWHMWMLRHAGLPNAGGTGTSTARTILTLRDSAERNAALVPGVRARLAELRDSLTVNSIEFERIRSALNGVENAHDSAELDTYIQNARERLAAVEGSLPKLADLGKGTPLSNVLSQGYTVIGAGRYAPSEDRVVAMVPVLGRGAAPIAFVNEGGTLHAERTYDVAVVLEEPPATVYSPVKTMLSTALLNRLLGYLDGRNCPPGYNFDLYDPANPYGTGQGRPSPHALLNRQLDRYEQAIVHEIDNATVDAMPDILRAVQQLVDARYFLNHVDEVIDAIMDREDWIYMLQSLIIGLMVRDGAVITDSAQRPVVSVDSGTIPLRAAEFLFGTVLNEIRARPQYGRIVNAALGLELTGPTAVTEAANLARVIRAEVLFNRAVQGLGLLKTLVDGSNTLVSNVHVGAIQHLIDVDLTNELMTALQTVFQRDYLGLIDKVEFEAPWECAEWTTQFAAMAFSVRHTNILYQAVDVASEIAADSGMASVATALARVGFDWTEIAPADLRVRGADQSSYCISSALPMAGLGCGEGYYNDAPIAHQGLKVTTIVPSYDVEAYNLVKAYLTMNTSRTYFAQPVGTDISDRYRMRVPSSTGSDYSKVLNLVLDDTTGMMRQHLATYGLVFEKTPALANVAIIIPYVANYLQKTAITRDYPVPQLLQVDTAKSLARTSGVTICPDSSMRQDILSPTNGLAVTVADRRSISTALPWIGS